MFKETPTKIYIRDERGISIELPSLTIRHHPAMWHPNKPGNHLAMVSKVSKYDGPLDGCHMVYLKPDGAKSDLSPGKIMRGHIKGRGVWIGKVTDKLNVCEGVETALSVFEMTGVATVAALSASNMAILIIPKTVELITIAGDNDIPGLKAAQAAAVNFIKLGIKVRITVPPNKGADWNDVLQQKRKGRVAYGPKIQK